jgi:hypothetical protein
VATGIPRHPGRLVPACLVFVGIAAWLAVAAAQEAPAAAPSAPQTPALSDTEIEQFLKKARVVRTRSTAKGVTNSLRVTLSDGTLTHDAHVQTVDERRVTGPAPQGAELNFRDSWMFNIAAYKIDRLIGLNLVPVSVERRHDSKSAAFTWWVDDVLMDEGERMKKSMESPRPADWNEQMQMVRVFDQLIYNMDRNLGNLLITNSWNLWAIDHKRAFRLHKTLKSPENITRCDRGVFDRLKALDKESIRREAGKYLTPWEIDAVLARRDLIVARLDKAGPTALFDRRDGRVITRVASTSSGQ